MGYSIGRWEGDVLVVESNGYIDRSWLDFGGHPHTEELRITERYVRRDIGRIDVQVTMVDPKVYAKPITFSIPMALQANTEMLEGFCENHHKSRERMVSTRAAQVVQVPAATLSRYVGTYDTDDNGDKHVVAITQEGTSLWFDYDGVGKELADRADAGAFFVVRHHRGILAGRRRCHEHRDPLRREHGARRAAQVMPRRRLNALPDLVRALPARQLIHLWLAIFGTFSSIGFVLDILTGGRQPAALLALNVIVSGLLAVGYAKVAMPTAGYTFFLTFISITATRYLRAQAEIAIASDIHRVLVPAVEKRIGDFECLGCSVASGDVGGDFVDLVELDKGWLGERAADARQGRRLRLPRCSTTSTPS